MVLPVFTGLALPAQFDPGMVITDQDFYSLPFAYSSGQKIQAYLESQGSVLANYWINITLEPDAGVISSTAYAGKPDSVNTYKIYTATYNQALRVSDLIWRLSQSNLPSSCSLNQVGGKYVATEICFDNLAKPINPAFVIAMIQKESGTIYGNNSKIDPNSDSGRFLLDRIVGYYCFETSDKTKSCYDENPEWKYYKGVFRQLFYAVRLLRLREQMCQVGGKYAFSNSSGVYTVGSTVWIDNTQVLLKNSISCAMYIYTPHLSSQRLIWQIMVGLWADRNLIQVVGLDPNYKPKVYKPMDGEDQELPENTGQ